MKRSALQNKQVVILQMAFRARKVLGTFEKRAPGARFSKVPTTLRVRKAIRKTMTCLFCKAGLLICCKGNKNNNNCKVSCLETPSRIMSPEIRPKSFGTFEKQTPGGRFSKDRVTYRARKVILNKTMNR